MLKRILIGHLDKWINQKSRKPLVLRGARQVGKTTLVRLFCEQKNLKLIEVNLEFDFELRNSFSKMNPESIIKDIELHKKVKFENNCLLFIDEIQMVPEALQSLRYFFEKKPELPVIAAGSLLEFILAEHNFSMPVGRVEYLFVNPLSFEEYLIAKNHNELVEEYQKFHFRKEISELYHKKFLENYFEYLIIGGMPEAVNTFLQTQDFESVKAVHRTIVLNYQNDFSKYSGRIPTNRLEKIFSFIPTHIGKKLKYSQIDPEEQAKSLKPAIELLEKAGVIKRVFHSDCSGIPIVMGVNEKIFKTIFLDIGLVNYYLKLFYQDMIKLYQESKNEMVLLHKGLVSEQFVGQQFVATQSQEPSELFYWIREGKAQNAEVDYVIQKGIEIIPVEVKFGKNGSIKSLLQFIAEKKPSRAIKISLSLPNIEVRNCENHKFKLIHLPIYFSQRINELLEEI